MAVLIWMLVLAAVLAASAHENALDPKGSNNNNTNTNNNDTNTNNNNSTTSESDGTVPVLKSNLRKTNTSEAAAEHPLRRPRDSWKYDEELEMMDLQSQSLSNNATLLASSSGRYSCESHRQPRASKCTGCPPMYKGKPCASTTWYEDTTRGACGCGNRGHVPDDFWTLTHYTAAINCVNLDHGDPAKSWCPANCGHCYQLCSTGGATQGQSTAEGVCRVFKVTNRCGDGWDQRHPDWCSQRMSHSHCSNDPNSCKKTGNTNIFGYPAHFDLQDFHRQITSGLGWDNSEVTFEHVSCDRWKGPQGASCNGCPSR
ncbi:unnamed protein product [Polarella glacialis]|uniref:Cellulase n=1 Tax=Polarella glacialis TaxID=89957 RepID=A0A813FJ31_POLGL|nr:unnamed protein product [Polarella glacialis]CAE8614844.1 unnamed protein product [Polarella glacialis]